MFKFLEIIFERILERVLNFYELSVANYGRRWLRGQSLKLALQVLDGSRKLALSFFFAFISCMILTAAVFSALMHELWSYQLYGQFVFDTFFVICAVISSLCLGAGFWFLRERKWLTVFKLDQKLLAHLQLSQNRQQWNRDADRKSVRAL